MRSMGGFSAASFVRGRSIAERNLRGFGCLQVSARLCATGRPVFLEDLFNEFC